MKKYIIALSLFSMAFFTTAQSLEQKSLYKSDTGFDIQMGIRNGKDTTIYFYFGYQNKEYTHITDIGSVFLTKREEVEQFANALNTLADKTEKTNLQISVGSVRVFLYDFSNAIYIEDRNGKYTTLTKKTAKEMAEDILANIHFFKN